MRKIIKSYVVWILVAIGVFGIAVWIGSRSEGSADIDAVHYEYAQTRIGDIDIVVSGTGQLQATQQVDLKAVAAGDAIEVTAVHVKNNEEVKEGQLLVSLDNREAARKVYDAQLSLESAEIQLKKITDSYDNKTVEDKRERQLQEITVKNRVSALAQARENLSDYSVYAPFDGVITDLSISSGDSISRTDVFASVITEENEVVVSLNEIDALSVGVGNSVALTFDAVQGLELSGKVSRVDTIGEISSGVVSYDIEIALDEKDHEKLRPGMSVNAEITAESVDDVIIVSNSAVKGLGDSAYVEKMEGGTVVQVPVSLGASNNFYTEITEGLDSGEEVIMGIKAVEGIDDEDEGMSLFGNMRMPGSGGGGR